MNRLLSLLPLLLLLACRAEVVDPLPTPQTDSGSTPAPDATTTTFPDAQASTMDADAPRPDAQEPDSGIGAEAPPPDAGIQPLPRFSFFVTSLEAMRLLSGSQDGFGGDLRHGEATGLAGADKICAEAAEAGLAGAGQKQWRAFLSASSDGAGGGAVHAIDRIGGGPWYDRNERLVAMNVAGLAMTRPAGDAQIIADLPNERGESQRNQPGPGSSGTADNHDVLTGSNASGRFAGGSTCQDWTSTSANDGRPGLGHSWPARSGQSWIQAHPASGCPAVVNLEQNGPGAPGCVGVGCGGGYGAIYCFALTP